MGFDIGACLTAGCEVLTYTSEEVVCQLPLELAAGIYRVVLWDPARGYGDQMPLLTVTASITAISPNTSQSPNSHLRHQKRHAVKSYQQVFDEDQTWPCLYLKAVLCCAQKITAEAELEGRNLPVLNNVEAGSVSLGALGTTAP